MGQVRNAALQYSHATPVFSVCSVPISPRYDSKNVSKCVFYFNNSSTCVRVLHVSTLLQDQPTSSRPRAAVKCLNNAAFSSQVKPASPMVRA